MSAPDSSSRFTWWRAFLGNILGMGLGSSAYVVYHNTSESIPASVSFFWFSLFAFLAFVFVPRRVAWPSPRAQLRSWFESFSRGGVAKILGSGTLYSVEFALLLIALQQDEPSLVITVLVIQLLASPLNTLLSRVFINERFHTGWWLLGTLSSLIGVGIYKLAEFKEVSEQTFVVNTVLVLVLLNVICRVLEDNLRAHYRRAHNVTPADAVMTVQVVSVVLGFVWCLLTEPTGLSAIISPTAEQFAALFYLGVVPTAAGITLINIGQDRLGFAISDSLSSMKPIAAWVLGFIPWSWLNASHAHLAFWHYAGMILAIVGVVIVVVMSRSKPGTSNT